MTTEHEPGSDEWRPWGQRAEDPTPAPEQPRPEPRWARLGGDPAASDAPSSGSGSAATQPVPTQQPSPSQPPSPAPPQPATTAAGPAYAPYAVGPAAAPGAPGAPVRPRSRRGPGWGALIGVALAVALVAGTVGGILGAVLADRGPTGVTSPGAAPSPGAGATTRPEGSIAEIAATATPSVVTLRVQGAGGDGTGSGWVYDDGGHIVTNNHVVASAADGGDITVVLANGQQAEATIVGRDASYDLAVVKVDRTDLAPLSLGSSDDVVVGDQVIAVGAPLGLDSTVTSGIVSALNRPVTPGEADDQSFINAIQTDAAINPGNSGGPLLDMQGRVIGVNSAIARAPGSSISGQSGNIGVGFAIPSAQVATTVTQLIETGKAVHPVIGVFLDSAYTGEGVRIADEGPDGQPAVNPGGPADRAGLRAGDVVLSFEGRPVSEDGELVVAIRSR
ncbi:MAG TPA: trypsin-like peptidase domain-containing protein, partial [Ornithinibacter sp.]|nr:trypsin-like peptidase domain-containing protein [Ornithinibacter sp.]